MKSKYLTDDLHHIEYNTQTYIPIIDAQSIEVDARDKAIKAFKSVFIRHSIQNSSFMTEAVNEFIRLYDEE